MTQTPSYWIEPHPQGLYVRPADIWIDPSNPVANAVITHGHADHARAGHQNVWATPATHGIMALRYGLDIANQASRAIEYLLTPCKKARVMNRALRCGFQGLRASAKISPPVRPT